MGESRVHVDGVHFKSKGNSRPRRAQVRAWGVDRSMLGSRLWAGTWNTVPWATSGEPHHPTKSLGHRRTWARTNS